jgi:hypothetical protein
MRWAGNVACTGKTRNEYKFVLDLGTSTDDQLGSHDNIKANLIDIERKFMDCVCVAQRAITWRCDVMLVGQYRRAVSVVSAALLVVGCTDTCQ